MICAECKRSTCITCDTIWHPSETCTGVAARRAEAQRLEEAAASQYLEAKIKLCPRCNVRGEKVSGCDHMTCKTCSYDFIPYLCLLVALPLGPQCQYQYCWICLVDFAEIRRHGNTGHHNHCRYHSDNLPSVPVHEAGLVPQAATVARRRSPRFGIPEC